MCCRHYLGQHYPGEKHGARYQDLWLACESIDIMIHEAWLWQGTPGINYALETNDALEHLLSRLGAEINYQNNKDFTAYQDMLTSKPPGADDIAPSWKVQQSRDVSKTLYQQNVRNRKTGGGQDSDDEDDGGRRRRRNTKKKQGATPKGDGKGAAKA